MYLRTGKDWCMKLPINKAQERTSKQMYGTHENFLAFQLFLAKSWLNIIAVPTTAQTPHINKTTIIIKILLSSCEQLKKIVRLKED